MADLEGIRFEPPELEEWVVPAAHYHYIFTCLDNGLISFSVENYQHVNVISLCMIIEISGNSDGCILYFNHSHLIFANSNQSFFWTRRRQSVNPPIFGLYTRQVNLVLFGQATFYPNSDQHSFFLRIFFDV